MKYAHIENKTNKLLGWYDKEVHGTYIEPVYEEKEVKDEYENIIEVEKVVIKEGYLDLSKIPTPRIEVTDEVWQEAIDTNANCYEDGKFIIKDFRTDEETKQSEYQAWKSERQNKVDNIEVEHNDIVYQGDETSQTRIARAISVMNDTETTQWVAKDNSIQVLNIADLTAILKEAGIKQTLIWNEGRPQ